MDECKELAEAFVELKSGWEGGADDENVVLFDDWLDGNDDSRSIDSISNEQAISAAID